MRQATDQTVSVGYAAELAYFDALQRGDRAAAERHAKRAFRSAAPAGGSPLLAEIEAARANIRNLAADVARVRNSGPRGMNRDLAEIAGVLSGGCRRSAPAEPVCEWCGLGASACEASYCDGA